MGDEQKPRDDVEEWLAPSPDPVWDRNDEDIISDSIRASRPPWLTAVPLLVILAAFAIFLITALGEGRRGEDSAQPDGEQPVIESAGIDPARSGDDVDSAEDDSAQGAAEDGATGDDGSTDATKGAGEDEGAGGDVDGEGEGEGEGEGDGDGGKLIVAGPQLPEPPSDAPYIDATLSDNIFVLSGVVPDEATKSALEARAELAYAPFNTSELVVDRSVGNVDWLPASPEVIGLLPMITDGTIRVQDDSVTLIGRSPNQQWADQFAGAVGSLIQLPVTADDIELTGLVPPRFQATVAEGKVTMAGEIPNQQLIDSFIEGAAAVYGPENVTSTMTVDETTYTSFWNYTIPGIFDLLQPFPTYDIQVADAATSGSMQGAVLFELNSAEISDGAQQVLPIGIALMARDLSLEMTVIGHTDNRGSDEVNDALSLRRAQSVVEFFIANGIDPDRLEARGKGSTDPLADNDTEAGRARNRRVEFVFG